MKLYLPLALFLYYFPGVQCLSIPTITRHPENATALVDRRFALHCRASGDPKPRITWEHEGEKIANRGQNSRVTKRGTLRFLDVHPSNSGWYRCKAQNERGLTYSRRAYLLVHAPAVIARCPFQKFVNYGHFVSLECAVAGIPTPDIQWLEDGVPIPSTRYEKMLYHTEAILKVNVTDDAKYTCVGTNVVVTGPTEESQDVNVFIHPARTTQLPDVEERAEVCSMYSGNVCREFLENRTVYYNHTTGQRSNEDIIRALLQEIDLGNKCNQSGKRLLCHYAFPDCHSSDTPTPLPLCRESCLAVREIFCYKEWILLHDRIQKGIHLQHRAHFRLPVCQNLPSKWNSSCTEAIFGEPDPNLISSKCYKGNARWYNGSVNVTQSGMACQSWSASFPHNHSRSPLILPELENSSNFCRNPGGEEDQPWCYTMNKTVRWDYCDVPECEVAGPKREPPTEYPKPDVNVIIIIGAVVVAGGLLTLALIILRCRRVLSPNSHGGYDETPQEDFEDVDPVKIPANISYHRVAEVVNLNPKLERLEYPRNDIIYMRDIGQGAFGRVFQAKAPGIAKASKGDSYTLVAVKMLKDDASDDLQQDFEREALLMAEFNHPNIVKLLGVCAMGKPMCLLFEYMSKGDLNEFLRLFSPELIRRQSTGLYSSTTLDTANLNVMDQLNISKQIAAGMVFLSEKGYVHRDLATRNCLVGNDLRVKISDFGLARSIHSVDVYEGSEQDAIPIRWMPVEAILYNKFTIESDVWSFGVVLWEIFSFALLPYYGMNHEEVVAFVKEGNTLTCPENTPPDVCQLMTNCWSHKPSARPAFQTAYKILNSLLEDAIKKAKTEQKSLAQNV